MPKQKPKKLQISHDGWSVTLIKGLLTVKKNSVRRNYDLTYPHGGIEHKKGAEYFYIRCEDFYYQFKFEFDDCLVGDKFTNEDEFLDTVANYQFV